MIAGNHWRTALGAWLLGGSAAAVARLTDPAAVLGLAPLATSASLGPDLDKPPEDGKAGATATEAHGLASNALGHLVALVCGGHRCRRHWWSTHRYTCAALVAALTALATRYSPWTVAVLCAWWCAWPLYCTLPYRRRWVSAFVAPLATAGALAAGWLPLTPWAALAVGFGWAAHIACDRLQSAAFALGGPTEHVISGAVLVAGSLAAALAVIH